MRGNHVELHTAVLLKFLHYLVTLDVFSMVLFNP